MAARGILFYKQSLTEKGGRHLKPSHKLVAVWRIRLILISILLLMLLRLLLFIRPAAGILGITVLAGGFLMLWTWIPRYCRKIRYRLDEDGLTIKSGLFFPRLVSLPQPSALYTCVYRTPLYLLTGLYGIAVWGAGVHALLPGLTQDQAQAVSCRLSRPEKGGNPQ